MLRIAAVVLALAVMAMAACSSPLGDGGDTEAQSTPTPTQVPVSPSPTAGESGEVDNTPAESTPTPESGPPEPTDEDAATASPTAGAIPLGGAELLINGDPVTRVVQGSDDGKTLYAISDTNLWRTDNGGQTWQAGAEGQFGPMIAAVNDAAVLYAGDSGGCGRGFSFGPFLRSLDAGDSWEDSEENRDVRPLLGYETQNAAYLYGTNCGLDVSADGGESWMRVVDLNGEDIFAVTTERGNLMERILVVGVTEGGTGRLFVFDTTDPASPLYIDTIAQFWGDAAVAWRNGRIVLAHAYQVGISDDDGETWDWTRKGLEDATYSIDPLFEGIPEHEVDPFRRFQFAEIDPVDRDRIWIGGNRGAYLSVDGGATWTRLGEDAPVTGLVLSTHADRVFISYESGARLWSLSSD